MIDAPVLDKFIQPIADRLEASGISIFNASRFLVDGAVVVLSVKTLLVFHLILALVVSFAIINISIAHRVMLLVGERVQKGSVNPCRVLFFPCRISSILLTILNILDFCQSPTLQHLLELVGFGLWMSGCYIGSCSRRPLQTNRVVVFA